MRHFALLLALFCIPAPGNAFAGTALPEDRHSGVVLVYHRIGEDAYPDSSLRTAQFVEHLDEIAQSDYTVLPLGDIIDAVKNGRELPPRALAITFEGAYKSAFENAIPLLLEKKLPFTVFYSSGQIDSEDEQYIGWRQLKNLTGRDGVSLGVLPASYAKLSSEAEDEIRRQVNKALMRHRQTFGRDPKFFSYPFGEYSKAYERIVASSGFTAAFGLHSGTIHPGSDFLALPRFTMTDRYGDIGRFRLVVNALPLPAIDIEPQEQQIGTVSPVIGFSLPPALEKEVKNLSCFVSGRGEPELQVLGNRVEIRLADIPGDERVRLNCTMPGPADPNFEVEQWRWLGMLLVGASVPAPPENETSPPPDEPQ